MPACHAGDRGFESRQFRHFYHNMFGSVAQSVEQRTENPRVGGSIPSRATFHGGLAKWPNAADCKSVLSEFGGSNPSASTSIS